jgi:glyoxalase family protein
MISAMPASHTVTGIHHVTAIAGDPQPSRDFQAGTLGLRLVKLTINFEDPGTYHLYFGNEAGSPGSILMIFPGLEFAGREWGLTPITGV